MSLQIEEFLSGLGTDLKSWQFKYDIPFPYNFFCIIILKTNELVPMCQEACSLILYQHLIYKCSCRGYLIWWKTPVGLVNTNIYFNKFLCQQTLKSILFCTLSLWGGEKTSYPVYQFYYCSTFTELYFNRTLHLTVENCMWR